ncbi:MAG: AAA family ATPase [Methylomonas sp.]|nr:AAA family ATPase [Methylomonas sp.]PPD22600.1 MAG: hypothetical protein CTY23_01590 [Methylomonas sp.]PPD27910.1 MAG: hypothetical protein CTY22_00470 [Methylomonas sp.]PPD40020.1 MAG: hypothetical protein CTY21_00470 [Methylomonas sp.]PPD41592.1 MAG: hypothetical protein CTY17_03680 [Methylomonas sp.]
MQANSSLTYGHLQAAARSAQRALLTAERSQKLDLAIHLLTNLQQTLVICGPQGIGKTTLLHQLIENQGDSWHICLIQATAASSFETIAYELSRFLHLSGSGVGFDLSALRAFCNKQTVVLIVDDADALLPGLIGELATFAEALPGFRLVLAMDDEALQDKRNADRALDDSHIIELPALSQQQCKAYLQNLSVQPGTKLSYSAIDDARVEMLFRATQGIPGKLLAELPKFSGDDGQKPRKIGLWLGVLTVCVLSAFGLYRLSVDEVAAPDSVVLPEALTQSEPTSTEIAQPEPTEPPATPEIATPSAVTENPAPPAVAETIAPVVVASPNPAAVAPKDEPDDATAAVAVALPAQPDTPAVVDARPSPKPSSARHTIGNGNDIDWILSQPANNITLQIMVLSSKDSVKRFIKQHQDYADNIKSYAIGKDGNEKYVVIYGSFQTADEAMKRQSTMPDDFKRGLEKRFKFVQREARR